MGQLETEIKKHARKIEVRYGDDIGEILKKLVELQKEGKYDYYVEIYGHKIYSVDVDYERDFKLLVGMSEEELNEIIKENERKAKIREEYLKKDAKDNLEKRIESGKEYIKEAKHQEWTEKVIDFSDALYNDAIDCVIKYINLTSDSKDIINAANEYFNEFPDCTTDWYQMIILANIARFSNNGVAFMKEIKRIAKSKNKQMKGVNKFIRELAEIENYIAQGLNYEKAKSLTSQNIHKLIIRDEFSSERKTLDIVSALEKDNHFIGIDEKGNLFIADIISNTLFGYYLNKETNEKKFIYGEKDGNYVIAYTSQSELLCFEKGMKDLGIISIEFTTSRKNKALLDNVISEEIKNFDPVLLTRLYNQLSENMTDYSKILKKELK